MTSDPTVESEVSAEFDKIRGKWSSRDRFGPIFGSDGALGSTSRGPAALDPTSEDASGSGIRGNMAGKCLFIRFDDLQ